MNSLPLRTRLCSHAPLKTAKVKIKNEITKFFLQNCTLYDFNPVLTTKASPAGMELAGDGVIYYEEGLLL